jgi:hypothetical protein
MKKSKETVGMAGQAGFKAETRPVRRHWLVVVLLAAVFCVSVVLLFRP